MYPGIGTAGANDRRLFPGQFLNGQIELPLDGETRQIGILESRKSMVGGAVIGNRQQNAPLFLLFQCHANHKKRYPPMTAASVKGTPMRMKEEKVTS